MDLDPQVGRFREQYRKDRVPAWYSGWLHFSFTSLAGLGAVLLCALRVDDPTPLEWLTVPAVLLSGDHESIRRWRLKQALGRTWLRRPDLLAARVLGSEEAALLAEFQAEHKKAADG